MDGVVERVAQYRTADVLGVCCIEHTVTLHLYLCLQTLESQIEEVAPVAAFAGLMLVFPEDAPLCGRLSHVFNDNAYRIILAEDGGTCQVRQTERAVLIRAAFALGTLTGLVVKGTDSVLISK